jgi:hypothetical protein
MSRLINYDFLKSGKGSKRPSNVCLINSTLVYYHPLEKWSGLDNVISLTEFVYDASLKFDEEIIKSKFISKKVSLYDSSMNTIEEQYFKDNGQFYSKHIYNYNSSGFLEEDYSSNGNSKNSYEYEIVNRELIVKQYTKIDGAFERQLSEKRTFVNGLCNERKKFSGESLFNKSTYNYDNVGLLIKEIFYPPQGGIDKFDYKNKFDKSGNLIEKITFKNETLFSSSNYKYENFDNKGNWLTLISFTNNNTPIRIVEREIEYK